MPVYHGGIGDLHKDPIAAAVSIGLTAGTTPPCVVRAAEKAKTKTKERRP